MPTAFTVSMLAWGALAFPRGYQKAGQLPQLLQTVRWGSDYLMKTWKPDTMSATSAGYLIIYQVSLPSFLSHSMASNSDPLMTFYSLPAHSLMWTSMMHAQDKEHYIKRCEGCMRCEGAERSLRGKL